MVSFHDESCPRIIAITSTWSINQIAAFVFSCHQVTLLKVLFDKVLQREFDNEKQLLAELCPLIAFRLCTNVLFVGILSSGPLSMTKGINSRTHCCII